MYFLQKEINWSGSLVSLIALGKLYYALNDLTKIATEEVSKKPLFIWK